MRIIEYTFDDPGRPGNKIMHRLLTTFLDEALDPAITLDRTLPRALGGRTDHRRVEDPPTGATGPAEPDGHRRVARDSWAPLGPLRRACPHA